MTGTLAALVIVMLTLLLAVNLVVAFRTRDPFPRSPVVLVVLTSGETVRGVLLRSRTRTLELGSAELLTAATERPTRIDGRVYIDRSRVSWIQSPEV